VQGWCVTQDNIEAFLRSVQEQLESLENTVAEVAGIAYDQLEALRVSNFVRQICLFRRVKPFKSIVRNLNVILYLERLGYTKCESRLK
jgi:transcriptional regulator NrdR family protein